MSKTTHVCTSKRWIRYLAALLIIAFSMARTALETRYIPESVDEHTSIFEFHYIDNSTMRVYNTSSIKAAGRPSVLEKMMPGIAFKSQVNIRPQVVTKTLAHQKALRTPEDGPSEVTSKPYPTHFPCVSPPEGTQPCGPYPCTTREGINKTGGVTGLDWEGGSLSSESAFFGAAADQAQAVSGSSRNGLGDADPGATDSHFSVVALVWASDKSVFYGPLAFSPATRVFPPTPPWSCCFDNRCDHSGGIQGASIELESTHLNCNCSIEDWLYSHGVERQPGPNLDEQQLTGRYRMTGKLPSAPQYSPPVGAYRRLNEIYDYECDDLGFERMEQEHVQTQMDQQADESGRFVIEVINPTTLSRNIENLTTRNCDMIAISEHAVPLNERQWRTSQFRERGWNLELSNMDQEAKTAHGGVALAVKNCWKTSPLPNTTEKYRQALQLGRSTIQWVQIDEYRSIIVAVIYGVTDSKGNPRAQAVTEKVFAAVRAELDKYPGSMKMIVGDFNGDPDTFMELEDLRLRHAWVDIGAVASRWGGTNDQGTCLAPGAHTMTRRDYMYLCPRLVQLVRKFEVDYSGEFHTHTTY